MIFIYFVLFILGIFVVKIYVKFVVNGDVEIELKLVFILNIFGILF